MAKLRESAVAAELHRFVDSLQEGEQPMAILFFQSLQALRDIKALSFKRRPLHVILHPKTLHRKGN